MLIKEYNKNNNERYKRIKTDEEDFSVQLVSNINKKNKLRNVLSSEKLEDCPTNTNKKKSGKKFQNQPNSIYNCSFKILKKLSNGNISTYSNMNTFTELKNSINLNVKKSIIGKKLFENNLSSNKKSTTLIFKSSIFPKTKRTKEEKENIFNSNLLLSRNKDINCNSNYYNKIKMIGQKKLFQ